MIVGGGGGGGGDPGSIRSFNIVETLCVLHSSVCVSNGVIVCGV